MSSSHPMKLPRTSLSTFLRTAKSTLSSPSQTPQRATFVIGNESAGELYSHQLWHFFFLVTTPVANVMCIDLDSLTSALLLAYFRTYDPQHPSTARTLHIPAVNIPASDLSLRPEYTALLRHANIDPNDLITQDDLLSRDGKVSTKSNILQPQSTQWILVDHNDFIGPLGKVYSSRVSGCIDHHHDEKKIPQDTGSFPRRIKPVGSCTSLVTEYCKSSWDELSRSSDDASTEEMRRWDAEIAKVGLASILIDTNNLGDKNKTTEDDESAAGYLLEKIKHHEPAFDPGTFFRQLDKAKKDIGNLPLRDILRKDYKEWEDAGGVVGISSCVKNISFLLEKAGQETPNGEGDNREAFLSVLHAFALERGLSVYSLMTTSRSDRDEFQRELLVWGIDSAGVANAKLFADENSSPDKLDLKPWDKTASLDGDDQGWRRVWWQGQTRNSRKQVAPMVRSCMQREESESKSKLS